MAFYRKKPVVIQAHQWFKNGDHPKDNCRTLIDQNDVTFLSEGEVVRHFRRPDIEGHENCEKCHIRMSRHGWIDTLEGGHIVCPGDYIITGVQGEHYPCKPDIFDETYEFVAK